MTTIPKKLQPGDHIRVIAPSRSLKLLSKETMDIANERLAKKGFTVSFGKHVSEADDFMSTTIEHRVEDLHEAFADSSVNGILTVIGGFNSNQLLQYIDWELIKNNPKVLCGYSDITALNNSIFAKTGVVTYSGPHYSSFGQKLFFEYTQENFELMTMRSEEVTFHPSESWFDDQWWADQDKREGQQNLGYNVLNEGVADGKVLGGNIGTFNLLQGTEFMPDLTNAVMFVEDDEMTFPAEFDRDLQSLIHQPNFDKVRGLVIGRFQKVSKVSDEILTKIIQSKKELQNIPVIAGVDFGHTDPKVTLPIGGEVRITAKGSIAEITFTKH